MMNARNQTWVERYSLTGAPYLFDLSTAAFERASTRVVADLCVVGTVSNTEGNFLWAWANPAIPVAAKRGIEKVRAFGMKHDLEMLIEPEMSGGRAEGLEALAIAGRVLDADGGWVDEGSDLTFFVVLFNFRETAG